MLKMQQAQIIFNKKVSIIVPVYNAEKYLDRSIKSLLEQTYDNLEIILIDDCSTDNSKKVIQKYDRRCYTLIDT